MGCNASKGGEVSTGTQGQSQATPRDTGNSSNQDGNTAANKQDGFQSIQDTKTSEKPADAQGNKPEVNEKQEVNEQQQQDVQESEKKEVQATEE